MSTLDRKYLLKVVINRWPVDSRIPVASLLKCCSNTEMCRLLFSSEITCDDFLPIVLCYRRFWSVFIAGNGEVIAQLFCVCFGYSPISSCRVPTRMSGDVEISRLPPSWLQQLSLELICNCWRAVLCTCMCALITR